MNQHGTPPAPLLIIAGIGEGLTGLGGPRAHSQSCASPAGCSPGVTHRCHRVGRCPWVLSWGHCHPGESLEEGTVLGHCVSPSCPHRVPTVSPPCPCHGVGAGPGWVLQEGEGAGPAAGRGKGRRQLPWKQKIKSMHPAGGFGGELGLARAGSLCPRRMLQPPARTPPCPRSRALMVLWAEHRHELEPGRGAAGEGSGAAWQRVRGTPVSARPLRSRPRVAASCPAPALAPDQHLRQDRHRPPAHPPWSCLSVRPSVRPSARCLSPCQCPERWPQLRWQRPR